MRTLLSIATTGLFLLSSVLYAQDYEFRVLANKGDITVKSGGSDWSSIRTGAKLQSGDELKLGAGGYIGLMHKSGKTLELKDPGTHKVSELANKVGSGGSSVASKYAEFVLSKMSPEEREENRRKYASVTGAVERATENSNINVLIPTSVEIYNENALVAWKGEEGKSYKVTLKNMFDEVILQESVKDTVYNINFDNEKLSKERLVILNVSLEENEEVKSGDYGLKRISPADAQKFEDELKELKASLGSEESSLNRVILAEFYEQNNLLLDASTNYLKAIELSPKVPYFKEVFNEFKMRNNLDK